MALILCSRLIPCGAYVCDSDNDNQVWIRLWEFSTPGAGCVVPFSSIGQDTLVWVDSGGSNGLKRERGLVLVECEGERWAASLWFVTLACPSWWLVATSEGVVLGSGGASNSWIAEPHAVKKLRWFSNLSSSVGAMRDILWEGCAVSTVSGRLRSRS